MKVKHKLVEKTKIILELSEQEAEWLSSLADLPKWFTLPDDGELKMFLMKLNSLVLGGTGWSVHFKDTVSQR